VIPPGGIPLAVGAVVMNVETAMNVAHASDHGHRKIPHIAGPWPNRLRFAFAGHDAGQCVAAAGGNHSG